jgi:hypothetical protein
MCWDGKDEGVEDGFVSVVASGLSKSVGFLKGFVFGQCSALSRRQ